MIFPLSGAVIGAVIGGVQARRRDGKGADIAQWAAVGGILGGILGLFALVFVERALLSG